MTAALEAVNKGKSVKRAPMEHGVPRTTLHDRHSGRIVHGSNTGPSITYIKQKRRNIVILLLLGEVGFGNTQSQIKDITTSSS